MKKVSMILFSLILCLYSITVSAEVRNLDGIKVFVSGPVIDPADTVYGTLYVNGTLIEAEDTVRVHDEIVLPLRRIFESLGAVVEWNEETEDIIIDYHDESYVCYTKELNPKTGKYFFIKKEGTDEYIYLNPMASGGVYCMINDRIYLYQVTSEYLFKAMGCKVEIDYATHTVKISN